MVVCCLAWGGGSPPACPPRAKGCLFHINLLSYRWLHLPRYQQRAPRQQQRPVRAPRHTFRDSSPYSSTYFFLALQLLHLLGLVLNIQACLPKHRQEPPGHQTSCLPVSGGDFQLHYLQGFLDILTWRPGIANYAATACHRMPQRGGRPHIVHADTAQSARSSQLDLCVSAEPIAEGRFWQ